MPARSTPFQQLVHHIQTQLAPTAEVFQSKMLVHRLTKKQREVDVFITSKIGEHTVNVSIECIEQKRPADVTWIEKQHARHQHLATDRLVLVSLSGFSQDALDLAEKLGVRCYTPEQARALDWTRMVGNEHLHLARYDFTPVNFWLDIETAEGPQRNEVGGVTMIIAKDGTGTLEQVVLQALNAKQFGSSAMSLMGDAERATLDFDLLVTDETFALDLAGDRHRVLNIRVKAKAKRTTSPIKLRAVDWNGIPAAFGGGTTVLGDTMLSVVEQAPGTVSTKIVVDGRELEMYERSDYDQSPARETAKTTD